MGKIRYGARAEDELRNRELEATGIETWTTSLVAIYETDPEAIAAVVPPPLAPTDEALVRISIATVDLGRGRPPFGAGTFAVRAQHDGTTGNYPLLMPMTTEQAVVGGRETFGEPKKLAAVGLEASDDHVHGWFERMGVRIVDVDGTITGELSLPDDVRRTDFYVKFLLDPAGKGFDADPSLVYCHREEKTRRLLGVDGMIRLTDSPFDPVADLPVRRIVSIDVGERSSVQRGEIVATLPPESIAPYVHQRYDDLSVTGAKD